MHHPYFNSKAFRRLFLGMVAVLASAVVQGQVIDSRIYEKIPSKFFEDTNTSVFLTPGGRLPVLLDQPGKFWLETNGAGAFRIDTNDYCYIVVKTNYGVRPPPIVLMTSLTREQIAAHLEQLKEEDRRLGRNQDISARERKLKKQAEGLKKGATLQDVFQLMGKPYSARVRRSIGLNQYMFYETTIEELLAGEKPDQCTLVYTPHEFYRSYKSSMTPYESLTILFKDGVATAWGWVN